MSVNLGNLSDFLSVTKMSSEKNVELIEFVDNVCGGNIRLALDFIRVFVGSGNVDTGNILEIYRDSGTYTVPLHEFLRAVIYGDQRDYDPRASEITNLFDIRSPDGREHFLGPIALAFIGLEARPAANSGYVDAEEIYAYAQSLGFQPAQIADVLDKLLGQKLLETEKKDLVGERLDFQARRFRITSTGITHIKLPGSKQRTILDESHRSITHGCRQPSNQAHKTISRRGELAAPGSGGGFHHVCTPFKLLRARTSPLVASLHLC